MRKVILAVALWVVVLAPAQANHRGLARRAVNNPVTRTAGRVVRAVATRVFRVAY